MNHGPGLTLEQAPPISVPLRFFLSAPLFGLVAAFILIGFGPEALSNRWAPATFSVTHLMTLGFLTMIMMGAMLQMMPVVAGSPVRKPLLVSGALHILLCLGTLALAGGLLFEHAGLMQLALGLLATAILLFLLVIGLSLARARAQSATVAGMRLATASLTLALAFGLRVGAGHIWQFNPALPYAWVNVHLAWALVGWVGLLVIAVAFEVVPMFQLTPPYPSWLTRWLIRFLFTGLLLWSIAVPLPHPGLPLQSLLSLLLATGLALFAAVTLYLQAKRRRRVFDVTLHFWRVAMLSLIACSLIWSAGLLWPATADGQSYGLLLGALFVVGFATSVINGMLYKIVSFLLWFHLQRQHVGYAKLPTVKEFIPNSRVRWQLLVHIVALAMLMAAVAWPHGFARAAGVLFAASMLLLAANLFSGCRMYVKTKAALNTFANPV